jgi:hypothetical protein
MQSSSFYSAMEQFQVSGSFFIEQNLGAGKWREDPPI